MLLNKIEFFLDFIPIMDFTPTHARCELYVVNPPPCPYNFILQACDPFRPVFEASFTSSYLTC